MAGSFDDDDTFATDGSGGVTCASVTCTGVTCTGAITRSGNAGNVRTIAADTATITLASTDDVVLFSTTGAGSNTIVAGTMAAGQRIVLRATAITTGTYTMASVIGSGGSGTLTFNAANEAAEIFYDGTNVCVLSLSGATVV